MKKISTTTAKEFERRFDEGADITPYIDPSSVHRPGLETRRVNVDFPQWVIAQLDDQSRRVGVSRQALIKLWIFQRIEQERKPTPLHPAS